MIKNEKQYSVTIKKKNDFIKALENLSTSNEDKLLKKIMGDSLQSQIEIFDEEIKEYKKLKNKKTPIIASKIEDIPTSLIKARIANGLTQKELAYKLGIKEQQLQRYEATDYESISYRRLMNVVKILGVSFQETKIKLTNSQNLISLEKYNQKLIREATKKLHQRKSLLISA